MNKSKQMMPKPETIERTVERLRKRFNILLEKVGGADRLAKRLGDFDEYFLSTNGYNDVRNAKREKAGEEAMLRILNAMEQLAATIKPSKSRVDKSLERMGISDYQPKYPTTQKLKEKMQTSKPK